jgi:uncharacterized protein YebE (UPF0316 family)
MTYESGPPTRRLLPRTARPPEAGPGAGLRRPDVSPLFAATAEPSPLLPVFIFAAEMCVVTLSTMRTIFVARGMKVLAPLLGFFEVSIWLFAIGQVMKNLSDWSCSAAFAGGFTLGNFLGILLEEKLAMGSVVVRVITHKDAAGLVDNLKTAGFGVTLVDGRGSCGPVRIVLCILRRKNLERVLALARSFDPQVFYSVDDLQAATQRPAASRRLAHGLLAGLWRPSSNHQRDEFLVGQRLGERAADQVLAADQA